MQSIYEVLIITICDDYDAGNLHLRFLFSLYHHVASQQQVSKCDYLQHRAKFKAAVGKQK